jgi:hypothetical protein
LKVTLWDFGNASSRGRVPVSFMVLRLVKIFLDSEAELSLK